MLSENSVVNARAAIESTYMGMCTVIEYRSIKDEVTKLTSQSEITVLENLPCRVSFESKRSAVQTDTAASVSQGIRLFAAPDADIKSGSKVVVTQNGHTQAYRASGVPAVYPTHREIMLELFEEWA